MLFTLRNVLLLGSAFKKSWRVGQISTVKFGLCDVMCHALQICGHHTTPRIAFAFVSLLIIRSIPKAWLIRFDSFNHCECMMCGASTEAVTFSSFKFFHVPLLRNVRRCKQSFSHTTQIVDYRKSRLITCSAQLSVGCLLWNTIWYAVSNYTKH